MEQALGQGLVHRVSALADDWYTGPGAGNLASVDDQNRPTVSGYALAGGAARAPTDHYPRSTARLVPSWVSASVTAYQLAGGVDASERSSLQTLPSLTRWPCCSVVPALMERIETLLAALDQRLATPASPSPPGRTPAQAATAPRPHANRESCGGDGPCAPAHQPVAHHPPSCGEPCPEVIYRWLQHYSHLCSHAPEVVGALLGLLRQCPGATAVIPALLEQVALSRRQRQALEATLHTPAERTTTAHTLLDWEDLPALALGAFARTLSRLSSVRPARNTMRLWWRRASILQPWC